MFCFCTDKIMCYLIQWDPCLYGYKWPSHVACESVALSPFSDMSSNLCTYKEILLCCIKKWEFYVLGCRS